MTVNQVLSLRASRRHSSPLVKRPARPLAGGPARAPNPAKPGRAYIAGFFCSLLLHLTAASALAQNTGPENNPPALERSPEGTKVGNNGAATFSIPIAVPPATAGIGPNLSLVYNSQSQRNHLVGIGWSLAGVPTIERCPATVDQDGFKGGFNYDANDRFCMDGMRLMAVNGSSYGGNGAEYRTEVDSGIKVISYGLAGSGPLYFKAWTKDGRIMEFGNTNDSRIEGLTTTGAARADVRVWALNKLQDRKTNYLSVTYIEDLSVAGETTNGDFRPSHIDYTINDGNLGASRRVDFVYTGRSDLSPRYMGGGKILTTRLLTNIQTSANNLPVRDYRLAYEVGTATLRSRLKSVNECDGTGKCLPTNTATPNLPPTWQFTWQEVERGFFGKELCGPVVDCNKWPDSGNGPTKTWVGDFDGDGLSDVASQASSGQAVQMQLSNGLSASLSSWNGALDTSTQEVNYVGDFDADGKSDIISRAGATAANVHYANSTGTNFEISNWTAQLHSNKKRNFIGDFNGDGRSDVVSWSTASSVIMHLSGTGATRPTGFATVTPPLTGMNLDATNDCNYVGDVNGDGKADIISRVNASTATVHLSTGNGFIVQTWAANLHSTRLRNLIGDFNGDGLSDIVSWDTAGAVKVHLSNGAGFDIQTWSAALDPYNFNFVGDFNGDNRSDIIMGTGDLNCGGSCAFGARVYYSTGAGFDVYVIPAPKGPINPFGLNLVGDFNGDNKADFFSYSSAKYAGRNSPADIQRSGQVFGSPDLLVEIANAYGGVTTLIYKPLTDDTIYIKDSGVAAAQYPNVDLQYPLYVVSDMVVSNGSGQDFLYEYGYAGAKAHLLGRGLLGFRQTTMTDLTADSKTTTYFNQDFPLTGLPSDVEIDRASDGARFLDKTSDYWNETAYTAVAPAVAPVKFVGPKQVQTVEYDGSPTQSRTTQQNFTFDSFATGNLIEVAHQGDITVTGDERKEVTDWSVDTTNWLHLPIRRAVNNGTGGPVREKWFDYDSSGLLIVEETNAGYPRGNANNPKLTYGYDPAFGVRTSVTVHNSADGSVPDCPTTTDYEPTKTFPAKVTNCLGHYKEFTFDAGLGVKRTETDVNRQPTVYEPDGFGRITTVIGPLDSAQYPTIRYLYENWGEPAAQRVITFRREQHGQAGEIFSEQFFDGLGRVDQTRSEGPDGKVILTEKAFDSRGLVLLASAPHFATENSRETGFMYDPLGRKVFEYHADGTSNSTSYERGLVTFTDERNVQRRKLFDGLGQLRRVDEINGNDTYQTLYEYDAAGALTKVTNSASHQTVNVYDLAGRKTSMTDPNMGTWTYVYNPSGTLKSQTDAKGQTLTFTYDELGRPRTKNQGATTLVTWKYDTADQGDPPVPNSTGRLTKVFQPPENVTTKILAYDAMGRVLQTQRILSDGFPHTMSQSYDALSRITQETFPDGDNAFYNYNSAGWLCSVGTSPSSICEITGGYINSITYNARGQKTQLVYANNVVTDWSFDPENYRVTRRLTGIGAAPPARIPLNGWANSWTDQPPGPPSGFMNLYRGQICVSDQTDACLGGDATADADIGSQIGYLKTSGGTGTVPVYRSTCYATGASCTAWGLSLDTNGSPVGYLSTTAPDGPSGSSPFVQSNGVLLQGISGTPSAYLWSPQSPVVVQTDHFYNNGGSGPTDYTASGLVGYLEQNTATGNVALRRYANTTTGHHYYSTANDPPSGFVSDGILGYLRTAADSATVGLYRHYSAATGDYVLTTSSAPPTGYALQATLGYLYTTSSNGSGNHQDLAYHYDEIGNVTAVVDNIFTGSRIYTYDALNRLATAYGYFGQDQAEKYCTYEYNSIGNIMNKCGVTFTYGDPMHPSAVTSISSGKTYNYDPNGNTQTGGGRDFAWNVDNRVTSVTLGGSVTSMEYDYTGARVKKDGAGGMTLYPFAGYEIDPNGTVTKFIRVGGEIFAAKKTTSAGATSYRFYHNDHLGGVNVITDSLGARCQLNEYDPWGGVSNQVGNCDPDTRFTGQKLDAETGLYYYGGRYYDPEISRFISADPFVPKPGNPQALNRYSYTLNNPVRYIDPSGYFYISKNSGGGFFDSIFGKIFGGLLFGPAFIAMQQSPPEVMHAFQIVMGIASILTLNPAGIASGIFNIASGISGLAGAKRASQILGGIAAVAGFLGATSGGAGTSPGGGGEIPPGESASLEVEANESFMRWAESGRVTGQFVKYAEQPTSAISGESTVYTDTLARGMENDVGRVFNSWETIMDPLHKAVTPAAAATIGALFMDWGTKLMGYSYMVGGPLTVPGGIVFLKGVTLFLGGVALEGSAVYFGYQSYTQPHPPFGVPAR